LLWLTGGAVVQLDLMTAADGHPSLRLALPTFGLFLGGGIRESDEHSAVGVVVAFGHIPELEFEGEVLELLGLVPQHSQATLGPQRTIGEQFEVTARCLTPAVERLGGAVEQPPVPGVTRRSEERRVGKEWRARRW